jgi:hypothetical protein
MTCQVVLRSPRFPAVAPAWNACDDWKACMDFPENVLARLASADSCGYHQGSQCATEPAALAALALMAHGRDTAAMPLLDWLTARQGADGSIGVEGDASGPGWATGWAVLAWQAAEQRSIGKPVYPSAIRRAIDWMLGLQGTVIEHLDWLGHDASLKGWPWVDGTHSWIEPTAINVLALKHTGRGDHPRAREAVRLLQDRLLASGGCNYGNTIMFGQELRPHLQPTGLCLLALAGETATPRVAKAIEYLQRELSPQTATASLCHGLMGLAAQNCLPSRANDFLAAAALRTLTRDPSGYRLALLALVSLGQDCPLIAERRPASTTALTPEIATP